MRSSKESPTLGFIANASKYFIGPKNCQPLKDRQAARIQQLAALETNPFNTMEVGDPERGLIAVGGIYAEVKKHNPSATVLRIRLAYPMVEADILRLLDHISSRELIIFEDGDPVVTRQLQQMARRLDFDVKRGEIRPRVETRSYRCRLCPGCPHRAVLYALKSLGKTVAGDAGCSALASLAPLECVHVHTAMGASIATAAGMNRFSGREVVALIGDAAFFHSGINSLINVLDSRVDQLVVILDNGVAALTGGQSIVSKTNNASTEKTDWVALLKGLGVKKESIIVTEEVYNYHALLKHIDQLSGHSMTKVLVVQGACTFALNELDSLVESKGGKLVKRSWRNRCDDCLAIIKNEKQTCLVALDLCGKCRICELLN